MATDYPTISYTSTSATPLHFTLDNTTGATGATSAYQFQTPFSGQQLGGLGGLAQQFFGTGVSPSLYENLTPKKEPFMGTRLVRWTVVDPDHTLASKKPNAGIILQGTTCLNGTDDKGFLMELAPLIAEKLDSHNALRATVEYDDEKGTTKTLKPIRLGQLDVVLEELKKYPA